MGDIKTSGITENTPQNIMFGPGTIHAGLEYDAESKTWNFEESLMGATSGGTKLTITPEFTDIDVDGATVKVEGLTVKTGETAQMTTNLVEITKDIIKMALVGQDGVSDVDGYDLVESKAHIDKGDYVDNFGYIGHMLDGTPVIVVFDKALCTSGFELEGKNKENGVIALTMECYATLSGSTEALPYHIYYPSASSDAVSEEEQ